MRSVEEPAADSQTAKPHGSSDWRYVLICENQNPTQRPKHTKNAEVIAKPRPSGEADELPLFPRVRQ